MDGVSEITKLENKKNNSTIKYLTFLVQDQHYGISISNIIEILQIQSVTPMPQLPEYFKGVINLRGKLVPLIDANLRVGNNEKAYTERTCIVIVDLKELYIGLIVDAVEEVLDIDSSFLSEPPSLSKDEMSNYVTQIARHEERIILLLDVYRLLGIQESEFGISKDLL